jgi:uncharacterized cofD-like protein
MKKSELLVLVGGGHGVHVAEGLKRRGYDPTMIQTVYDSGGHSGKIRREHGILALGDMRRGVLSLADDIDPKTRLLRQLAEFRFEDTGTSNDGENLGNLILLALVKIYRGNVVMAVKKFSEIMGMGKGNILPVSLDHAELCARMCNGTMIYGEENIDTRPINDDRCICFVTLKPEANLYAGAAVALARAKVVGFCPGDLYTSVIPNILTNGFRITLNGNKEAKVFCVVNIMTKKAETHGFTASRFVREILKYLGRPKMDAVICNNGPINSDVRDKYRAEEAYPVEVDYEALRECATEVIVEDVVDRASLAKGLLRHDSDKMAELIVRL